MLLLVFTILASVTAFAQGPFDTLRRDMELIVEKAGWPRGTIQFDTVFSGENTVRFTCNKNQIFINVKATHAESTSTLYYGLHKLGFLFPHPKTQISPTFHSARLQCGKTYEFKPALPYRGFHLQTHHPNEWARAFFEGDRDTAEAVVMWIARNMQNVLQVQLIRTRANTHISYFKVPADTARALNIRFGISLSFTMFPEKSYRLLPWWSALTGINDEKMLTRGLDSLGRELPFDFVTVELGSSEFTNFGYNKTIRWLDAAGQWATENKKFMFARVHATTNQHDDDYGNFNFLPQYANANVGALAHTVFFYGLRDGETPVYGRRNFADLADFITKQKLKRNVWYYPETGHFSGMDIDVPIFLTDYLAARAADYKFIVEEGLKGHITSSTGQELGHWLFDWTAALQALTEYLGDPLAGVRLLKEDVKAWEKVLTFQTKHIKGHQVVQSLTSSNLLDELAFIGSFHGRILPRDFVRSESHTRNEITQLEAALAEHPFIGSVKNEELRLMLQLTHLRMQHAVYLRKAALARASEPDAFRTWMAHARRVRGSAGMLLAQIIAKYERYPDAKIFNKTDNVTSYGYGYGWSARTLHYWEREERIVSEGRRNPFFMNIFDPIKLLL